MYLSVVQKEQETYDTYVLLYDVSPGHDAGEAVGVGARRHEHARGVPPEQNPPVVHGLQTHALCSRQQGEENTRDWERKSEAGVGAGARRSDSTISGS